jgi:hypothetical protein
LIQKLYILPVVLTLILAACSAGEDGELLAEAYGKKLYDTELKKLLSPNMSFEDSVLITKEYVNVWLGRQILLNKAETVLSPEEKDKSKQIEQYKSDLLSYEVLNKLAIMQVDTSFADAELEEYYEEQQNEFELSQNILKINFFKIPQASEDLDLLWSSFKQNDFSIYSKLKALAEGSGNYYMDKESWVYFNDILKELPISTYDQEQYLNNNKFIKIVDGSFVYFIKIIDFKIRSTTSPFSLERDNIKELLLMKRQQAMVKSIETKLLEDAYNNKQIKTY